MFPKLIAATVAAVIFGTALTPAHAEGPAPLRAEGEAARADEGHAALDEVDPGSHKGSLERIGRRPVDLSPASDNARSLLGADAPAVSTGLSAVRRSAITADASPAFDEIASIRVEDPRVLEAMLRSKNPNVRRNAYVLITQMKSHDVAIQMAIARALLAENVKSARRAAAMAVLELAPTDPNVLELVRKAAVESHDFEVRIIALRVLLGGYRLDQAAQEISKQVQSPSPLVRSRAVELLRQVRRKNLSDLFDALARAIPTEVVEQIFPDAG